MSEHQTALVTGGASGIGRATVERFLAAGWSVMIADFNADSGAAMLDDCKTRFGAGDCRAEFIRVDVSSETDMQTAIARTTASFGRLDCMVNNAGIGGAFGPVTDLEVADWDYTFAVLVRGVFLGTKHAARVMKAQGTGGAIVNTASIAGLAGGIGPQAYSAAKAAVISFTKTTAVELAPHNIRVNAVSPGVITTPLVETGRADVASAMAPLQPWPAPGMADDIARVIEFLAGDGARFITGENIVIDGGLMASGPRLGDAIGGDPAARGLAGVNRGSTGLGHVVTKLAED